MLNVEKFCEARKYIVECIDPYIETFLGDMWDPCIKFALIRDTQNLIKNDVVKRFPDMKEKFLPKVKFRLHDEAEMTQVSIQHYYNIDTHLVYLGSAGIGSELFDFYYNESFDPRFKYSYTAKFGHGFEQYYSGSKTPEAEYLLGAITPLAIAYSMALEEGVI